MAKYSADIEIAVRGGQQVDGLIKNLNRLNNSINVVNRNAKLLEGKGFNVASMENYSRAVLKAENAIRKAAQGTQQEEQAVRALVTAMDAENKARARRNFLIAQEVASRRQVIATANAGFGMQGPQAAAIRAGRGPASPIRGTVNMPGSPAALAAAAGGGAQGGRGISGRLGGAISGSIIGGAFPLLFGQGGGAATGGAIGGLVGGLAGPGGSFAGSLLGTLLGDIASRGQAVKQLADDIGFSAQQTKQLSDAFKVANTDVEKFTAVIQNIRGVGLEIEDQAKAIQLVTRLTELYGGSFEKTGNAITSVLESGKVTQANLNQLTSQGINIQQALADKYNVNRDAILKMAKDGKISVQDLVDTLVDLGNKTDGAAKKQQNVFEAAYRKIASAAGEAASTAISSFTQTGGTLQRIAADIQSAFTAMFGELIRGTSEFILGLGEIARIAGSALDGVAAKFIEIQYGIIGAAKSLPVLDSGIIEFAKNALAVLNPVGFLIDKIRGVGRNRPQQFGPEPPPVSRAQIEGFRVPSQAASSGAAGAKGPKPPANRTADLLDDLNALKLISTTQDGIRDAIFEGNRELAIQLDYDQKVYDIQRDTKKALRDANYESEKAVLRAQEIVRLKDAELERDDQLRELARDINEIIANTLDDLRGGITWDDTGMREIFDMRLPDAIKATEDNLRDLTSPSTQIIAAATAISDAFSDTFRGIVSGSMTAKEALSNFFKGIGDAFTSMAAQIIAEAIKLQAIKFISSLIGSAVGSFASSTLTAPGLEGAGALSTAPLFPGGAFAEGGFVTGPTNALIGEAGQSEYVIPASKMSSAMARYSAGARGESVLSGNAPAQRAPQALDINYNVTDINGMRFVTEEQFTRGMRDAAKMGQAMTFSTLRSSPSVRRKLGV